MSALFTPLTIRETVFQNRVWVSPMCQVCGDYVLERPGKEADMFADIHNISCG